MSPHSRCVALTVDSRTPPSVMTRHPDAIHWANVIHPRMCYLIGIVIIADPGTSWPVYYVCVCVQKSSRLCCCCCCWCWYLSMSAMREFFLSFFRVTKSNQLLVMYHLFLLLLQMHCGLSRWGCRPSVFYWPWSVCTAWDERRRAYHISHTEDIIVFAIVICVPVLMFIRLA